MVITTIITEAFAFRQRLAQTPRLLPAKIKRSCAGDPPQA
jgi:hypothetical protein